VAVSSFSDLETIVRERAWQFHLPSFCVDAALARPGQMALFPPEEPPVVWSLPSSPLPSSPLPSSPLPSS
jgi:hypothetical protein